MTDLTIAQIDEQIAELQRQKIQVEEELTLKIGQIIQDEHKFKDLDAFHTWYKSLWSDLWNETSEKEKRPILTIRKPETDEQTDMLVKVKKLRGILLNRHSLKVITEQLDADESILGDNALNELTAKELSILRNKMEAILTRSKQGKIPKHTKQQQENKSLRDINEQTLQQQVAQLKSVYSVAQIGRLLNIEPSILSPSAMKNLTTQKLEQINKELKALMLEIDENQELDNSHDEYNDEYKEPAFRQQVSDEIERYLHVMSKYELSQFTGIPINHYYHIPKSKKMLSRIWNILQSGKMCALYEQAFNYETEREINQNYIKQIANEVREELYNLLVIHGMKSYELDAALTNKTHNYKNNKRISDIASLIRADIMEKTVSQSTITTEPVITPENVLATINRQNLQYPNEKDMIRVLIVLPDGSRSYYHEATNTEYMRDMIFTTDKETAKLLDYAAACIYYDEYTEENPTHQIILEPVPYLEYFNKEKTYDT